MEILESRSLQPVALLSVGDRFAVKVIDASGIPRKVHKKLTRFYLVDIVHGVTRSSQPVENQGSKIRWDETLDGFEIEQSVPVQFKLYAKRSSHDRLLIGEDAILFQELRSAVDREISLKIEYEYGLFLKIRAVITLRVFVMQSLHTPATAQLPTPLTATSQVGIQIISAADEVVSHAITQINNMRTISPHVSEAVDDVANVPSEADGVNESYQTWKPLLDRVGWVVELVDGIAVVHPYAKIAWSVLSVIPRGIIKQVQRDEKIMGLTGLMQQIFETAREAICAAPVPVEAGGRRRLESRREDLVKCMFEQVIKCGYLISSYAENESFWTRAAVNAMRLADKEIDSCFNALTKLREAFQDTTIHITSINVEKIIQELGAASEQINDLVMDALLQELPYGDCTSFDPLKGCLPGTRTGSLKEITSWINGTTSEQQRALILFGRAGTGKSTIAHEIARQFRDAGCLTTSFFFARDASGSKTQPHNPRLFFTTLIRDLCYRYPTFKKAACNVLRKDAYLRKGAPGCSIHFKFLEELLKDLRIIDRVVIVIDSLDESGDQRQKAEFVSILSQELPRLPSFRIIITARAMKELEDAFKDAQLVRILRMDDTIFSEQTSDDIHKFVKSKLDSILPKAYSTKLAAAAGDLFQWASVACDFVLLSSGGIRSPIERADILISGSRPRLLDDLYFSILDELFPDFDAIDAQRFHFVMSMLLYSFQPLSQDDIATLAHFSPAVEHRAEYPDPAHYNSIVQAVVGRLGSLLSNVRIDRSNHPIGRPHMSFREFLTDENRSRKFFVGMADVHRGLATACLKLMLDQRQGLRFNICDMKTSCFSNSRALDVDPSLKPRVEKAIPPPLVYACLYWDDHLAHTHFDPDLFRDIKEFFEEKFLFWLEVLSVKNVMKEAIHAVTAARTWLLAGPTQLNNLLEDCMSFLRVFGSIISQSAPHIYLSALPFSPTASPIFETYRLKFQNALSVTRGRLDDWPVSQLTIQAHHGPTRAVAFTSGGDRLFSCSDDHTIQLWDATTGEPTANPLLGHSKSVLSIGLAPLGDYLVSASADGTVRLWSVLTGDLIETLWGPLAGVSINAVAYSYSGNRIAAASNRGTIRIWETSEPIRRLTRDPLSFKSPRVLWDTPESAHQLIHNPSPYPRVSDLNEAPPTTPTEALLKASSLALSSRGDRVVTCSGSTVLQMWDNTADTEAREMREVSPELPPGAWLTALAYSPLQDHLVLGFHDGKICVWDATSSKVIAGPMKGHSDIIRSLAFSRSGNYFVSGSADHTVLVWDKSYRVTTGPFEGHHNAIWSVAFSPSEDRVASGSDDGTIRMWDAIPRPRSLKPLERSRNPIWSVAFSSSYIAAGFDNGKIRILRVKSGEVYTELDTERVDTAILSLAFSPAGDRIAAGSLGGAYVWDVTPLLPTGKLLFIAIRINERDDSIWSVAFSPSGDSIAMGSGNGTVQIWSAVTGNMDFEISAHSAQVRSLAYTPSGAHIVSGSDDGTVWCWETMTGKAVIPAIAESLQDYQAPDSVLCVTYSPSADRVISSLNNGTICWRDGKTGNIVKELTVGLPLGVGDRASYSSSAFSPDGRQVATGSPEGVVHVWDVSTGELISGPFAGHSNAVSSIAYAPAGGSIVSGSTDGTMRVWNVSTTDRLSPTLDIVDQSTIVDGWLTGSAQERVLWVPEGYRAILPRPSNTFVVDSEDNVFSFDYTRFVHGDEWAKCYTP